VQAFCHSRRSDQPGVLVVVCQAELAVAAPGDCGCAAAPSSWRIDGGALKSFSDMEASGTSAAVARMVR
jgi:hypothetical protein